MKLCQLEFYSRDVEASLRFAGEILGWKKVPVAIQDQTVIMVAEDSPYGISIRSRKSQAARSEQADSPSLLAYFEVNEKLSLLRDRCLALGGIIIQEPVPLIGYGIVMTVEDQGGLRYGLYEAHFEGPRRRS